MKRAWLEWSLRTEQRRVSAILRDLGLNDFLIEKVLFVLRRTKDAGEVAFEIDQFRIPESLKQNILTVLGSAGFIR